jgi:hypothetical protein
MKQYILFCIKNNLKPSLFTTLQKFKNENYKKYNRPQQSNKRNGHA